MAKISNDEIKIKLSEKIKKAEKNISLQREKIKNWQNELKTIEYDEKKIYAEEFLSIVLKNGITDENEKEKLLAEIEKIVKQTALAKKENISLQ